MARSKRSQQDPTGQAKNRKRATRALDARLNKSEILIKRLFKAIPSRRRMIAPIANQEDTIVYEYVLSPAETAILDAQIREILNDELETEGDFPPPLWFWDKQIEPPYRQGTVQEINKFNQMIAAAIIAKIITDPFIQTISIDQVLQSSEYLRDLRNVIVRNYGTIKTLSERTASQVIQKINQGVSAGFSPSDITKDISERFDVSKANAKRIADTEINRAFNDAKLDAGERAAERTGLKSGVIHISALLPTTRPHHAARHGKSYTVAAQRQWWDTGVNRINCHCSVISVLVDRDGNVVQREEQAAIKAERKFFDRK